MSNLTKPYLSQVTELLPIYNFVTLPKKISGPKLNLYNLALA